MISDTLASSGLCFSFTSSSKRTSNTTRGLESELAASRRDADPPSTPSDSAPGSLHPSFVKSLELLQLKFEQLMRMQPYNYPNLPKTMPKGGVYLFSEKECHLYVGRSTKIRTTYGRHCN